MNKRNFITRAIALAALAGNAAAQEAGHTHHHDTIGSNAALLAAAADCLFKG